MLAPIMYNVILLYYIFFILILRVPEQREVVADLLTLSLQLIINNSSLIISDGVFIVGLLSIRGNAFFLSFFSPAFLFDRQGLLPSSACLLLLFFGFAEAPATAPRDGCSDVLHCLPHVFIHLKPISL